MDFDLVIKNGTIVTAKQTYIADIGIRGEKIAVIDQNLKGTREIDARDKLVTPGAVDIHVHMEMPLGKFVSSDDFFTGTRAAAYGGTTTIIDFVEPEPDESMLEALKTRRGIADPKVVIDYGLHMTIGPDEIGKLNQLPEVYDAGCPSFKLYMAYGFCLPDDQLMLAMEAIRDVNGLPVIHTENWPIITALIDRNLAAGNNSPSWHPRSRPAVLEGEAAGRAIDIATFVGTRLHIFHITCADVVDRLTVARGKGLPVTGETCPQYLLLTQDVYDRPGIAGALPVCSPPIRDENSQQDLWQALGEGNLQVVSTDHCPFTKSEKATGLGDYSKIPGGVPSVEIRFPALFSSGVETGRITLNQWVDLCCTTPARIAGLDRKGDIAIGLDADLVIFDPEKKVVISQELLHEDVDWTPYEGLTLKGWPQSTISRGEVIVENGEFGGQAGRGRFIRRHF
ncbi:MAG TPA: dihydropyrimidinase [candidate division Zixibacteria bacterium]|nr:dihydropyrimidinase [candidate division Zixibacteria bacterium]